MDNFIRNLADKYKARLRRYALHLISRGHANENRLADGFWNELLQNGDAEDISNYILVNYTDEFKKELVKASKEFVDSYGNK